MQICVSDLREKLLYNLVSIVGSDRKSHKIYNLEMNGIIYCRSFRHAANSIVHTASILRARSPGLHLHLVHRRKISQNTPTHAQIRRTQIKCGVFLGVLPAHIYSLMFYDSVVFMCAESGCVCVCATPPLGRK